MSSKSSSFFGYFLIFIIGFSIGVGGLYVVKMKRQAEDQNLQISEEKNTEVEIQDSQQSVEDADVESITESPKKRSLNPYEGLSRNSIKKMNINPEDIRPLLENKREVLMQGRIAVPFVNPHTGKAIGFRATIINEGSLAESLGFKNKDVLLEINGKKMNSIDAILETYYEFRENEPMDTIKVLIYRE